jgi:hypothetical protein
MTFYIILDQKLRQKYIKTLQKISCKIYLNYCLRVKVPKKKLVKMGALYID